MLAMEDGGALGRRADRAWDRFTTRACRLRAPLDSGCGEPVV